MVKADAHKDTILSCGPELVGALRQAYQEQAAKLQVLAAAPKQALPRGPPLPLRRNPPWPRRRSPNRFPR